MEFLSSCSRSYHRLDSPLSLEFLSLSGLVVSLFPRGSGHDDTRRPANLSARRYRGNYEANRLSVFTLFLSSLFSLGPSTTRGKATRVSQPSDRGETALCVQNVRISSRFLWPTPLPPSFSLSRCSLGQCKIDRAFKCHRRTGRVQRNNRSVPVFRSPSPSRDLASSSGSPPFTLSPRATDPELKPRYGSRDTINARDIKLFAIVSPFVGDTGLLVSSRVSSASPHVYSPTNKYPRTPLLISLSRLPRRRNKFRSLVSRGNQQRHTRLDGISSRFFWHVRPPPGGSLFLAAAKRRRNNSRGNVENEKKNLG